MARLCKNKHLWSSLWHSSSLICFFYNFYQINTSSTYYKLCIAHTRLTYYLADHQDHSECSNRKSQSHLGRNTSPPLTAENHAINSPIGYSWMLTCPYLSAKLPLPLWRSPPPSIHLSLDNPTHHPKQHPDLISHFSTDHPQDWPTDGIGNDSFQKNIYALLLV